MGSISLGQTRRHADVRGFTIGQRKGLGVALGEPHFVIEIDAATRDVVLGPRQALERQTLSASGANWLTDAPVDRFEAEVQIRYNSSSQPAEVIPISEHQFQVQFHSPASGVAPGQLCVVYAGDRVLGGGWID